MIPENLGAMVGYVGLNTSGIDVGVAQAQAKMSRGSVVLGAAAKKMTMAISVPLIGLFAGGGVAYVRFQDAMTKSLSIMGDVSEETRREMELLARSLSKKGIQSATNLAKSYFFLASAGMDAQQSMKALPIVERFATAGAFDMALATDLLTDAQTAMGLSSKDAVKNQSNLARISDVLVKANTLANASTQQFSEALTADAATAARGFGTELETVTAALAAYADKGIKGQLAGNTMARGLRLMKKAVLENGEAFKKYNIDVIDKATGEYRNFIDVIGDMEGAFNGLTRPEIAKALDDLGFQARAQKSITPLLGMTAAMKGYEAALREAGGTTQDVFDKQLQSPLARITMVWNRLKDLAMVLFEAVLPAMEAVGNSIVWLTEKWEGLSTTTQNTIGVTLGIVAVLGPLAIALSVVAKGVWLVVVAVRALGVALLFLTMTPIGLLITAVIAVAGYFVYAALEGDNFAEKMEHLGRIIQSSVVVALEAVKLAGLSVVWVFLKIALAVTSGVLDIKHYIEFLITSAKWMGKNWKLIFERMWENTKTFLANIGENLGNFFGAIKKWMTGGGWDFEWKSLTSGMKDVFEGMPDLAERAMTQTEKNIDGSLKKVEASMAASKKAIADGWNTDKVEDATSKAVKAAKNAADVVKPKIPKKKPISSGRPELSGAIEKGTAEAYSIIAKRGKKSPEVETAKNTKDSVDQQKKTNILLEKMTINGPGVLGFVEGGAMV